MDLILDEPSITDDLCFTPLHHVVIGLEQADLRQQLRLNSLYVSTPDALGRSPLHWAVLLGEHDATEALLAHGASPDLVDKEQMTPLHNIYLSPSSSQRRCAELLLEANGDVNALDKWGRTPLRIVVGYEDIDQDLVGFLLEKGADVNLRDMYAQSPLLKSISGSHLTTRLLLDHGADIEARDIYGNTPLIEAIYRNKPRSLQLLLEHGAMTDTYLGLKAGRRAREGPTCLLDFAIWYGSLEVFQTLEEWATNHRFLTPTDKFDEFLDFRLANGREVTDEAREAFARIHVKLPTASCPYLDSTYIRKEGYGSSDNEIFFDAHDDTI